MEGMLQVFIETLFDFRRGLFRQIKWLDDTIENLTVLKDKGGEITESDFAKLIRAESKQPVRIKSPDDTINPSDCDHAKGFENGQCFRCGVYEEYAGKGSEDIE